MVYYRFGGWRAARMMTHGERSSSVAHEQIGA